MLNVEFNYLMNNLIECIESLNKVKSPSEVYYLKGMINTHIDYLYKFCEDNQRSRLNRALANHYESKKV